MTRTAATAPEWRTLLASWDDQQTGYLPRREERFAVMARIIGDLVGDEFTALDLACGPGSLAQRVLDRYQGAHCIALDTDPALMALGRHALTEYGSRLRWVDADLRDSGWTSALGADQVDVVMSTTALHWLDAGTLFALYRRVARLLRPGGIFLNGDNMPFESWQVSCDRLATEAFDRERREAFVERGVPDWDRWWTEASTVDALASAIAERTERRARAEASYGIREGTRLSSLATHMAALSQAGFADVGTVWQHLDDRVLLAVR